MFLWNVWFKNDEWTCFVIAPTRGRAKSLFYEYWKSDGEFTDVRVQKVKPADGYSEAVHDVDCPDLEALGVRYMTGEELDEWLGLLM